ncbi:MAG TPA: ABC transporter ATP-binding protein, partial [Candidatus Paceibacterota bacterium]|nr:ABC transporter ATP-binding protein [Candidatus Paceibacterota bacterium]
PLSGNKEEILSRINFSSPYVSLPGNLTVRENLLMFARLYGKRNAKEKIVELARTFEIEQYLDKMTVSLSTGQITRVNLAKAFINDPELLLLDEPTASLDPDIADKTLTILQKMQQEKGVTILYTSHNMQEIERICQWVVFINHGKVREEGTPADLVKKFGHQDLNDVFISIAREHERT